MKFTGFRFLLSFTVLVSAALAQPIPAKDRTIIVISLDGFPGYAWDDPRLPVPHLRKLAKEGVMGEGMTPPNPTVTWPSHTTMITGVSPAKHGVLFNGLPVRNGDRKPLSIAPWRPKDELVLAPTVYDKAYAAGLTTAQVDWVAISEPKTITWQFPEVPNPEGQIEREMVAAGNITAEEVEEFMKSNPAWRDEKWTQAAIHIVKKHKPNLLLFHLLNIDSINHSAGPKTAASNASYALADKHVGELLRAVEEAGLKDKTTIFVVSDHGFKSATRIIKPNALLRDKGLLTGSGTSIECDAYVLSLGGTAMFYVTNPAKRDQLIQQAKNLFRATEGIEKVIEPGEYATYGYPQPTPNGRMGDLVLAAKDGYAFNNSATGEGVIPVGAGTYPGHHGYLNSLPELRTTFIAWGKGIQKGKTIGRISAADLAPTIAYLLGLDMGKLDGQVVKDILTADSAPSK